MNPTAISNNYSGTITNTDKKDRSHNVKDTEEPEMQTAFLRYNCKHKRGLSYSLSKFVFIVWI